MASPFPGIDPYLEGSLWSSVLPALTVEIGRRLSPRLRPRYVAMFGKQFVTDFVGPEEARGRSTANISETVPQPTTTVPESVPVHWVEIRRASDRCLVTAYRHLDDYERPAEVPLPDELQKWVRDHGVGQRSA